ncbi:MAG TPA: methytransferase partner Trm112 [Methanoregulaceae archaeon]|nr:methytransferase partner Trm112 [Methanoregulaceae archaeon]HQJ87895.1 methytransferase partner Trm112 [Methanoregulaceae archaeon]
MKKSMMEILCCPVCKGDLTLEVTEEDDHEVLEGHLRCSACSIDYPIEDGIPNLLPPGAGA